MKKAYESLIESSIRIDEEIKLCKQKLEELGEQKSVILRAIDSMRKFVKELDQSNLETYYEPQCHTDAVVIPMNSDIIEPTPTVSHVKDIKLKLTDHYGVICLATNTDYNELKTEEDCIKALKKLEPSVLHKISETIAQNKRDCTAEDVYAYLESVL